MVSVAGLLTRTLRMAARARTELDVRGTQPIDDLPQAAAAVRGDPVMQVIQETLGHDSRVRRPRTGFAVVDQGLQVPVRVGGARRSQRVEHRDLIEHRPPDVGALIHEQLPQNASALAEDLGHLQVHRLGFQFLGGPAVGEFAADQERGLARTFPADDVGRPRLGHRLRVDQVTAVEKTIDRLPIELRHGIGVAGTEGPLVVEYPPQKIGLRMVSRRTHVKPPSVLGISTVDELPKAVTDGFQTMFPIHPIGAVTGDIDSNE